MDGVTVTVTVTVEFLMNLGVWGNACEVLGINPWAANEGLASTTDTLTMTLDQAHKIGLAGLLGEQREGR